MVQKKREEVEEEQERGRKESYIITNTQSCFVKVFCSWATALLACTILDSVGVELWNCVSSHYWMYM